MRAFAIVLAVLATAACASAGRSGPEPLVLGPFVGTLPCADCPGILTELTLTRKGEFWAEGTYLLKQTYIDRGPAIETTGDWTTLKGDAADDNAVVYQLEPDRPEASRSFVKLDETSIRQLDRDFKEVPGPHMVLKTRPAGAH